MGTEIIKVQTIYTEKEPGNWKKVSNEHLPEITIYKNRKQNIVIHIPIKKASTKHYIEKIAIVELEKISKENKKAVNKKFKLKKELAVKVFSKHAKYFEAIFSLHPVPKGKQIMVIAKCNLHDLWSVPFSEAVWK